MKLLRFDSVTTLGQTMSDMPNTIGLAKVSKGVAPVTQCRGGSCYFGNTLQTAGVGPDRSCGPVPHGTSPTYPRLTSVTFDRH